MRVPPIDRIKNETLFIFVTAAEHVCTGDDRLCREVVNHQGDDGLYARWNDDSHHQERCRENGRQSAGGTTLNLEVRDWRENVPI
ncbi:hypothetical protein Pla144_12690 [Bythopirellula polymerisocia]|uniref:Uncharacterized protein n=1 Tax=Bythopirellula polymerisocia TaxID=2528003 RepID=A0A5C6D0Q2_9BACT|nr:hypothetical protein Pla144_12690 [Bythopirellula polymerisocia]